MHLLFFVSHKANNNKMVLWDFFIPLVLPGNVIIKILSFFLPKAFDRAHNQKYLSGLAL
jgi:hypothetical protein